MLNEKDVTGFEDRINIIKKDYDLFMAGVIKVEPYKGRDELTKWIRSHTASEITNSSLRFKYNSLIQKFNSLSKYWDRMVQMRDEARAKISARTIAQKTPEAAAAAPAAKPAPAPNNFFSQSLEKKDLEAKARKVFEDFTAARQQTGEGAGPDFTRFKTTIEKRLQELYTRAPGSEVEFKVAVEGGKVKLKAVARAKN